jgi:hypothetical protein
VIGDIDADRGPIVECLFLFAGTKFSMGLVLIDNNFVVDELNKGRKGEAEVEEVRGSRRSGGQSRDPNGW